jgi:hypothetical protein
VLVPIYLYHRYQVDAAAKSLGGVRFIYGKRGAPFDPPVPVAAADQRRALDALLETLTPATLDLPDAVLDVLPPGTRGFGYVDASPETLAARTDPAFDPFTAAETAADLTLAALLDPRRAERLVRQHALDERLPSLDAVIGSIEAQVTGALQRADETRSRVLAQRVAARYAAALIALDTSGASPDVRAGARAGLGSLIEALPRRTDRAFAGWLVAQIDGHLDRPAAPFEPATPGPVIPQGSPIGAGPTHGSATVEDCWHCR